MGYVVQPLFHFKQQFNAEAVANRLKKRVGGSVCVPVSRLHLDNFAKDAATSLFPINLLTAEAENVLIWRFLGHGEQDHGVYERLIAAVSYAEHVRLVTCAHKAIGAACTRAYIPDATNRGCVGEDG
eukprot:2662019-Pleurochrysis_carterae.AAC.1